MANQLDHLQQLDADARRDFIRQQRSLSRFDASQQRESFRRNFLALPYQGEDVMTKWRREAAEAEAAREQWREEMRAEERRLMLERAAWSSPDQLASVARDCATAIDALNKRLAALEDQGICGERIDVPGPRRGADGVRYTQAMLTIRRR
jgi:hypothetical protein